MKLVFEVVPKKKHSVWKTISLGDILSDFKDLEGRPTSEEATKKGLVKRIEDLAARRAQLHFKKKILHNLVHV